MYDLTTPFALSKKKATQQPPRMWGPSIVGDGYMRVKLLKRRSVLQGTAPANHNYRFELESGSEELRQRWIASPGHQRVWPPIERFIKTKGSYPVVLYDEM